MNHATAKGIAVKACYALQPFCERINIAGSIRRLKPEVKDIEILVQAKEIRMQRYDMFGQELPMEVSITPGFVEAVNALGDIVKGKVTGRYMQIELPEGIKLDLFMPQPDDYYRQYAIRTGSATYAQHVIAGGWLRLGWCGVKDLGLRRQSDCVGKRKPDGKTEWKCVRPNAAMPPKWESEEDFFKWINVPWIEPKKREM